MAAVETNDFKLRVMGEEVQVARELSVSRDELINIIRTFVVDPQPDKLKLKRKLAEHDKYIEEQRRQDEERAAKNEALLYQLQQKHKYFKENPDRANK